jgi:DHA1 family multidrug resistance protein-like MFS transporter
MEQFGVSEVVATLGLSLFVLGYAAGPMFWAPLSETPPFGRTTVYMSTLLCFILLNFGVVYASNIGMLLAFRFLTAFFGSPVLATGGASLADLYAPQKRAYAIGIWGLFAVAGPTMGPLVGGFAVQARDWTWSIWELIWLATFTFVLLLFTLPETSPQNILFRRAYRLRKFTGNHAFKTEADVIAASQSVRKMMLESLSRPFTLCFTEPILVATNGYLGLVYAILYTWFEAFPLVFADIYHFNLGESGLAYLGLLIGAVGVTLPYCYWLWRYQEPLFDEDGNIAPEKRLPPAVIGSAMIPVCLFW